MAKEKLTNRAKAAKPKKTGGQRKGRRGWSSNKKKVQRKMERWRLSCNKAMATTNATQQACHEKPDVPPQEPTLGLVQTYSNIVEQRLVGITHGKYPFVSSVAPVKATRRRGGDPVLRHAKTDEVYGVIFSDGLYWLLNKCWSERLLFGEFGSGQCVVLSHRIAFLY
jgi:hypothetical protein